jgi:hypothetical protein
MRLRKHQSVEETINGEAVPGKRRRREGRGWGPFSGAQLTVVIVAIAAMFAIPTAALAAGGAFTNNSATVPAVKGTNSNAHGTGVQGTGKKYGVYSNGPLGVAAGKSLSCTKCVSAGALSASAKKGALIYSSVETVSGPYTEGEQVATFSNVPAGLMCVSGSATAFASSLPPGEFMELEFAAPGAGDLSFQLNPSQANVRVALPGISACSGVNAGTYTFTGDALTGITASNSFDTGSITVQVFSR